ncbi:sterile alpha motif domain-containing protein 9-like [Erpetoichthys calabaricus]|uniref:Sterile alpha motif domain-containing protein 9-like n=1 Tax=Erpetoichthys calabaricus TaxID=27687 RepID=A0A8C4T724_ERPCA|nr:sterile alpha motif domain-containing protein 9-like [Erpetoichthys calabaricus]
MDYENLPVDHWTEDHVSFWLKSLGIKEQYIKKLHEEEVTGLVLKQVPDSYFRDTIGMKGGQAELLLTGRARLQSADLENERLSNSAHLMTKPTVGSQVQKEEIKPRPFGKEPGTLTYRKHGCLPPETGIIDLISPCREFKSLADAVKLDEIRLQSKFAKEVIRFACGCMNMRTNGTIHFGVVDNVKNSTFKHGEVIGIPVEDKSIYIDAFKYIKSSFDDKSHEAAHACVQSPHFIKVFDQQGTLSGYVIEVDIVSSLCFLKGNYYGVRLPNFKEESNKVINDKVTIYQRVGASTESIDGQKLIEFGKHIPERDRMREEAETPPPSSPAEIRENLARKLSMLLTGGKKYMDDNLQYILVTSKWKPEELEHSTFLFNMKLLCVFDFDPDSEVSGLCHKYFHYHEANLYSLQKYMNDTEKSPDELIKSSQLFEKTNWIFCNGRRGYLGGEESYDVKKWIKTRKKHLKKAVSVLCNDTVLPKGSYLVLFLLMSPIEQALCETFHEFYTEMSGHEDIVCISESEEQYNKWFSFMSESYDASELKNNSIVGMKISHVDATIQSLQLSSIKLERHLLLYSGGHCPLKTTDEDKLLSLEVLSANQCENTNLVPLNQEQISETERNFYHGSKVAWINFWLAETKQCGDIPERDSLEEVQTMVQECLQQSASWDSVAIINICHHPGSGGSTVARQVLWSFRKRLRCAVVKTSCIAVNVCEHAISLREYEEKDRNCCLPVLLLVEDTEEEYLDDLKQELEKAIDAIKVSPPALCFILLSCNRSYEPEKMCRALPLQTVAITHRLTEKEKLLFAKKLENLRKKYNPDLMLTFVLMANEFDPEYQREFVSKILQDLDRNSRVTLLLKYIALLSGYVQNSYVSLSRCLAFLAPQATTGRFSQLFFQRLLSEQAKFLLIHLKDSRTGSLAVRIIHPLVAKEILSQLLIDEKQSDIAIGLLQDEQLLKAIREPPTFFRFLRDLLMRRCKKVWGDELDTLFSPFIEHVLKIEENYEQATRLLELGYELVAQDGYFAQQVARVHYTYKNFKEAREWTTKAKFQLPHNSYILDTEGQVFRRWFSEQRAKVQKNPTAEEVCELIDIALKAMSCFRESQEVAGRQTEWCMNSAGYFSEVNIGMELLELLSTVDTFAYDSGHSELLKYLCTDYIPEEIKYPWTSFHSNIKNLRNWIYRDLEWISEDLSYYRGTKAHEGEESTRSSYHGCDWLATKTTKCIEFFQEIWDTSLNKGTTLRDANCGGLLSRWTEIYKLRGGNVNTILHLLNREDSGGKLERIIDLYPPISCLTTSQLVSYILCQVALACSLPSSPKQKTLLELSHMIFKVPKQQFSPGTCFVSLFLFWPGQQCDKEWADKADKLLTLASETLKERYDSRKKNIPQRQKRIQSYFFLGNGDGLNRFINSSRLNKETGGALTEQSLRWSGYQVWANPQVQKLLRPVQGWTERGKLYIQGNSAGRKIRVPVVHRSSAATDDKNVTFYIGFSFSGPVAYNIRTTPS